MASWIIFYGISQSLAPKLLKIFYGNNFSENEQAFIWAIKLLLIITCLGVFSYTYDYNGYLICMGLFLFGFIFAINSSIHSYLILALAKKNDVTLDVGFYYMSNAVGRLLGTVLSGLSYQLGGVWLCLAVASVMLLISAMGAQRLRSV